MQLIAQIEEWEQQKDITKDWTGIVFYPEKNTTWHNIEHNKAQQQALQKNIFATIGIAIGLGLFAYTASLTSSVALLAFGLFSLVGLVIAFLF